MRRTNRSRLSAAFIAALAVASTGRGAGAQQSVLLQGIVDGEAWATNTGSLLLSRNGGKPATLARLQLWGAYEPVRSLVIYAQSEMEHGSASLETEATVYTDLFAARWSPSPAFVVDAGKLAPLIGTFTARHFSTRNPLIGMPDGYSAEYPTGVKVSGEVGPFDYRAGMVSLPATHEGYQPTSTARLRPAIGAGYRIATGFRIGGSYTRGPYLNESVSSNALYGHAWSDYDQRVAAVDVEFSHGYLETHFEAARGTYEVPNRARPIAGVTYYGEAKYTFTPRFFTAARIERNDYPFIRPTGIGTWVARLTDFADGEVGAGYRLTTSTLLKLSYRRDKWWAPGFRGPGGHALAFQLSQSFDVIEMLDRARER